MHTQHLAHMTMGRSKEVKADEIKGKATNAHEVRRL